MAEEQVHRSYVLLPEVTVGWDADGWWARRNTDGAILRFESFDAAMDWAASQDA